MLRSSLRLLASPLSFALSTEGPGVSASTQPREDVSPAAGRTVPMKAIKFGGKLRGEARAVEGRRAGFDSAQRDGAP